MSKRIKDTAVVIGDVNLNKESICVDWPRSTERVFIDGVKLAELLEKDADGAVSEDYLIQFFQDKILYKITDANVKRQAAAYLITSFHQGGWLHFLGSALVEGLSKASYGANATGTLSIATADNGFALTEKVEIKSIRDMDGNEILPDEGSENVLSAQASVSLEFNGGTQPSRVTITEARITFGNDSLQQELADGRNIMQWIIDALEHFFTAIKVEIELLFNQDNQPPVFR